MEESIRQTVRHRAKDRCEYCRLRQEHEPTCPLHIDHIIAIKHQGAGTLENLALACGVCNRAKGTNVAGIDPDSGELTRLYHPRNDIWEKHFQRDGALILGRTAIGRTTVWVLQMNIVPRVELRALLLKLGELD
jgi:hypothetical protein